MKQLVVERNNPDPILWDTPIPQPGPGEVLIKNHFSVVSSGTELATIDSANRSVGDKLQDSSNITKGLELLEKEGASAVWNAVFPKNILPIQLGYSSSGEVVQVGEGVKDFHVGDKVVSNGNHAEYVIVNQNLCTRIPDDTSMKEAAFTVLGSIALHGLRLSETSLGSKVVVIGLGIVGQLVCRLAEAQGSDVIGIDPDPTRHLENKNFYETVEGLNLENVDSVIITAASSTNEPIEVATKIARNKAKIVVVGDIPLNISRNEFYYKELELVIKAIDAGKAVYVEKPLAIEASSITDIEEAMYNADNPKIFLGFNRRFAAATEFIKTKLNNSPANSINFRFSVPPLEEDHWTNVDEIGGGRIVGEAIHAIDLACYLFDSLPQSISSSSPIDKENNKALDNQVFLNINFANGSHAAIQYFSETNQALTKERVEIHGNGNSYIVEDFQLLRYLEGTLDKSKIFNEGKGHKESITAFFAYVRDEISNPYTWLELKSISLAGIYAQKYLNSGKQHSVFS